MRANGANIPNVQPGEDGMGNRARIEMVAKVNALNEQIAARGKPK